MTSEPKPDKTKQGTQKSRRRKAKRGLGERLRKSSSRLLGGGAVPDGTDLFSQVSMMVRAFMASPVRNTLIAIGTGIFLLVVLIAVGQVAINRWNEPFYDALARRDLTAFFHQLMVFFGIAGSLLVLNVSQTWLNLMFKLKLREGWRVISSASGWSRDARSAWPMREKSVSIPTRGYRRMRGISPKPPAILASTFCNRRSF